MLRHRCWSLRSPWGFAHRDEGLWRQEQLAAVRRKWGRLNAGPRTSTAPAHPLHPLLHPTDHAGASRSALNCRRFWASEGSARLGSRPLRADRPANSPRRDPLALASPRRLGCPVLHLPRHLFPRARLRGLSHVCCPYPTYIAPLLPVPPTPSAPPLIPHPHPLAALMAHQRRFGNPVVFLAFRALCSTKITKKFH